MAEMSASGLLSKATGLLSSEQYSTAVPYLKEYLQRMEGVEESRVLDLTQRVRLKLGKLMAWLGDPAAAVSYLRDYTENLPRYRPGEAWKLMAVNLYAMEQYEPAIVAATNALSRPSPQGLPGEKRSAKVDFETLSEKERGGFTVRQLQRIEEDAAGEEDDLSQGFSAQEPEKEPEYSTADLVVLNMTLAESYAKLEQWQQSVKPYRYVVENAAAEDRRGFAVMQLVNALVTLEQFDEASDLILELAGTDVRYDIRVNMAMMNAASALLDADQVDSSLMLYRMVLPRSELVDFQNERINQVRRDAGLPEVTVSIVTNDMGRIGTLFGKKYLDVASDGGKTSSDLPLPPKPDELLELEEAIGVLAALPPYENEVLYRTGLLFAKAGRPWESATALEWLIRREPETETGHRALAELLMVLIDPLQKYEEVETKGWQFLESHIEGLGPRMVAHALTISYQKQERWKEIRRLRPVIDRFVYSDDEAVRQYECELFYMQAIADMVLLDYKDALAGFEKVLTDFPGLHQQESATYWHAMAQLFLKNHQTALDEFDAYLKKWPEGSWVASAEFHSGICLFGLEKLEAARERFTKVIDTWPDSEIYPDACSLRGDLLAADGLLEEAQLDYREAIASARTVKQATYAVFQLVSMFEMEDRADEILETVDAYLARYGEEADIAKAAYWIGKTKLAQGLTAEAIEAYRETIIQYGGDVLQDGVDLILSELLGLYRRLTNEERAALRSDFQEALKNAQNGTLQLRLRVLLAEMDGTIDALGRQLLAELDDLTQAPPPVLAALCDASLAMEDYSRSGEILNIFQTRYEDSDFMRSALKLRGFGLFEEGEDEAAWKIAEEAQALYGTDVDVVWAQLLKGRVRLRQGDFSAAHELFRTILTMGQWRGDAYAEATYYLGRVEEASGNIRDAFSFYQRAYFQYKGLADGFWAAEGYLASARCLEELGLEEERVDTYRAMLFDKYVNTLPQAEQARAALGPEMAQEISSMIAQGLHTNVTIKLSAEDAE